MPRKKYLVLRNCFTQDCVYYKKGDVVELSDAMFKNEKNFRPMGEPEPVPVPEPAPDAPEAATKLVKEAASAIPPEPVVHKKVGKSLTCSCGKEYKTKYGLKQHLAKFNS